MEWVVRVFTDNQIGLFRQCHLGRYVAVRFDNLSVTIEDYHDWCEQEGFEPTPINQWGKNITIPSVRASGKSYASFIRMMAYADRGDTVLYCTNNKRYKISLVNDQEEVTMKALYRFYGLNRRTGAFLEKMVVGVGKQKEALNAVLLDNAAEITLNLGDPAECMFALDGILDFEPIESED